MNIKQMAKQAGFEQVMRHRDGSSTVLPTTMFERFRSLVLEEAAKVCEEREQRFNREDARAACRLCAKGIRALADQINAAIDAAKGEPS